MSAFKNKVVWITGASSGIGEALAYQLAKQGSRLVLSSRRQAELERVKQNCQLPDDQILILPLDLMEHEKMTEKAQQVFQFFGAIDVLINNGGISQRSLVKDTQLEVIKRIMDIDYIGTVALSQAVLPYFVQQRSGHFAVVSSLMGKFSSPFRSAYCGAKHALHGFFDALRMEHEADNIKVTIFCPGYIKTKISLNALTEDGSAQQKMDQGQDQGMTAEECAIRMLRAIQKGKMEVLIGGKETWAVYIKRFFPKLLHRIVMKANVT